MPISASLNDYSTNIGLSYLNADGHSLELPVVVLPAGVVIVSCIHLKGHTYIQLKVYVIVRGY